MLVFVHGVHLNAVLKVCCCVHLWPHDNNVCFGEEVSSQEGQDTEECGKHLRGHGEGLSVDQVEGEEAYPGDHVHQQAEGDTLGLIVVGGQVLPHVTEREAEDAEDGDIRQLNA